MSVVGAILAAGQGTRFGGDKTAQLLLGRPIWRWSFDMLRSHPSVDRVVLVGNYSNIGQLRAVGEAVLGGTTRQQSSKIALEAAGDANILLLHDAARPFASSELTARVIEAAREHGAAAAAVPVTDTIKRLVDGSVTTLDRTELFAMQTPQAASTDLLRRAHAVAATEHTDDMALLEAIGVHPRLVQGEPENFKITNPQDLFRAQALLGGGETRTGLGYDIHPFSKEAGRALFLGGVHFPEHVGLEGHSDADVLLHAVTDALLGAAGLGDIGQHFPNTDPRWRGEPSLTFLLHSARLLSERGWRIVNVDISVVAEAPKIMKRADEIRAAISQALALDAERVSVKATTNERLGAIGREEGIAAFAVATIRQG